MERDELEAWDASIRRQNDYIHDQWIALGDAWLRFSKRQGERAQIAAVHFIGTVLLSVYVLANLLHFQGTVTVTLGFCGIALMFGAMVGDMVLWRRSSRDRRP
jgi:hypothetical protein